ncbi:hypothetical protein KM043_014618 [Ampulex compressa]|nr:hypothetical protein KM043_014618 [Ampulex compressa]
MEKVESLEESSALALEETGHGAGCAVTISSEPASGDNERREKEEVPLSDVVHGAAVIKIPELATIYQLSRKVDNFRASLGLRYTLLES